MEGKSGIGELYRGPKGPQQQQQRQHISVYEIPCTGRNTRMRHGNTRENVLQNDLKGKRERKSDIKEIVRKEEKMGRRMTPKLRIYPKMKRISLNYYGVNILRSNREGPKPRTMMACKSASVVVNKCKL